MGSLLGTKKISWSFSYTTSLTLASVSILNPGSLTFTTQHTGIADVPSPIAMQAGGQCRLSDVKKKKKLSKEAVALARRQKRCFIGSVAPAVSQRHSRYQAACVCWQC